MPAAAFLACELLFLAAAHLYGGPPWTLLGMLACFAQIAADFRVTPLARLIPSLAWLALFRVTGNRELFFPFAMYLATYVALIVAARWPRRAWIAGALMVATFLLIRMLQAASTRVLAVECVVALAILAAAITTFTATGRRPSVTVAVVSASSLAAYAALAL